MGHLNYIGVIFFSSLIILALIFFHKLVPVQHLITTSFISLYIIATSNINRCILPYRKQQPGLIFVSKRILLKHLFFTIGKGYSLQLLLTFLISITFMLVVNQFLIIILAVVTIIISFLSQLTSGLFKIIIRLLFLLQLWFVFNFSFGLSLFVLVLQSLLIYLYIKKYHSISLINGLPFLDGSNKRQTSGNISHILFLYIINNKVLIILLGALVSVITYFGQQLLNNVQGVPSLIIVYVNFMTILEIMIGSKSEEIMLDKARVETLQSSLIISPFKRFKSSSIYLISLMLIILCVCGLVGIVLNTPNFIIFIKSLFSIPLIFLVGIVYFRKTELLTCGYEYKLLKLSLPILMLIFVTFFTVFS